MMDVLYVCACVFVSRLWISCLKCWTVQSLRLSKMLYIISKILVRQYTVVICCAWCNTFLNAEFNCLFSFAGVLDKTESLTPLGEHVACMSCDPRLGKVLVLGALFRCVLPMLSVAASLTRDPFHNSLQNRTQVTKVKCCNAYLVSTCTSEQ